ncbi:MAG: sec-independent protein translocase protein TatB [Frankiales bacterium]|nr:sec-independent protein translocase protein TatB [Frankiales bacterium]
MLGGLGWPEAAVLLLLGLFVFGPDRLPGIAADAGRTLRKLRLYLKSMSSDLKAELGPEVADLDLRSLHPREFVRKHLLEDDPDEFAAVGARQAVLLPGEPAPWDPDTT